MDEWWSAFFAGNWLDVQRNVRAERTSDEVAFLESTLNLTPGCRILDVPCGNGRLALPLAERGYRITGVDITKVLLKEALSTSREANLDLELHESDMRDICPGQKHSTRHSAFGEVSGTLTTTEADSSSKQCIEL